MTENSQRVKMPHNIIMEDRCHLTVSGISDVDSFDEQTVIVFTDIGELTIKGENLHINRLSLEMGEILVEGTINSLSYSDNENTKGSGFFGRVFR
ncbi:MAG: sporulation protein YabP [Oscillospiraceae bacterium]